MIFIATTVVPIVFKLLLIIGVAIASYYGWDKLKDNVEFLDDTHDKYAKIVSFIILIILVYLLFLRSFFSSSGSSSPLLPTTYVYQQ